MKNYTAITIPDTLGTPWRSLHVFNLYRLTLTGLIAVIFFYAQPGDTTLGSDLPGIFKYAIVIWTSIALISGFASRLRWPDFHWQVIATIVLDINFITLLMYASGGMESGLGTLMLVTVAASGILLSGGKSFAFAAMATLAILAMHSYSVLLESYHTAYGFTHIGLLGVGLFAVALLTHTLALRIRESEALASQRGTEIADLSQINELIIQQMDIGVLVVGSEGEILLGNDAALRILNTTIDITGHSLAQLSPKLHAQFQSWQEGTTTDLPPLRVGQNTSEVIPRFSRIGKATTVASVIFLEDTAQLAHQAQQIKLASLGRLTASIAHEIRNPLSAIQHAGQLLSESKGLPSEDQRLTEIIQQQSNRLDTIVENILSLSRKQNFHRRPLNINTWLNTFSKNLRAERNLSSVNLQLTTGDVEYFVTVDPSHLEQVLCNICDNGIRHAKDNADNSPLLSIACAYNPNSNNIVIDIIDSGPGISLEDQEKIFEPFFTSEPTGTGLGLYIARELCELNSAHISYIDATPPAGRFRLIFTAEAPILNAKQ